MKHIRTILIIFAVIVLLFFCGVGVHNNYMRAKILKLRISDVGLLLDTYFQVKVSNSAPTMEDLLSVIKRRGLTLNNPIPKNPTLRNYEIITNALENDYSTSPDVVIIQETENVDDDKTRIKGRADGSVTQSSKLNYTRQP
jgi:hypothetical protein